MPINSYRVNKHPASFKLMFAQMQQELIGTDPFDVGEWQSIHKSMPMHELRNVSFSMPIPASKEELAAITAAHLPWAEDHFHERVGGKPLNPSPSEAWWPFAQKKNDTSNGEHKSEGDAFSHTYPERLWPKFANQPEYDIAENDPMRDYEPRRDENHGIRFAYGDLEDVVRQLGRTPYTRQAFIPIWFPEDTGAVHGKRVPCTLGYHFAIRDGKLDVTYYMRSTDLLRHFQDDVYMAARLGQWMVQRILSSMAIVGYNFANPQPDPLIAGELIFHTANLHIFHADLPAIAYRRSQGQTAWPE